MQIRSCCLVTTLNPTLLRPQTVVCQAPRSMEFSRQEYWSRLPFPSPRDLPNPDIKTVSCIAGRFFTTETPGKPNMCRVPVKTILCVFVHCYVYVLKIHSYELRQSLGLSLSRRLRKGCAGLGLVAQLCPTLPHGL